MIKIIFFDIDGTLVQLGKNEMTQKVKNNYTTIVILLPII